MAGAPKSKPKKKSGAAAAAAAAAMAPSNRVKSAKEMRNNFIAIKSSPDGFSKPAEAKEGKMDLTPACIECTNCKLPVFVKNAAVATDKTFERLELKMGGEEKKKMEQQRKDAQAEAAQAKASAAQEEEDDILADLMKGLEDDTGLRKEPGATEDVKADDEEEEEGEEDEESLDTIEALERKVEDFEEKIDELEGKIDDLEQDKADLEAEVEELKTELANAKDRISFLEESEMRWRDKYRDAMLKVDELLHEYEGMKMTTMDRETNIVKLRSTVAGLKVHCNARAKRRNGLLVQLWRFIKYNDKVSLLNLMINLWRPWARITRITRERDDQERQYREDCYGRCWQVGDARIEEKRLHGVIGRNEMMRRKGGQQLLARFFNTDMPWILARPFKAWTYAHPTVKKENAFDRLTDEHKALGKQYKELDNHNKKLSQDLDREHKNVANLKKLNEEGYKAVKDAEDKLKREAAMAAKEARRKMEDALAQAEEKFEERFKKAKDAWGEIQTELENKLVGLQDAMDALTFGSGGSRRGDKRVVPRGQGLLCLGCLRQILHRDAKPLPPVEAYSCSAEHILDIRNQFYEDEFRGALKPNDEIMNHEWKKKVDPVGVTPLSTPHVSRPVTSESKAIPGLEKQEMRRPRSLASLPRPASKDGQQELGPPKKRVVWR